MKRKPVNVISMSFLDAMTCGFGAVILFFMIIAANVDQRRDEQLEDVSAEVNRIRRIALCPIPNSAGERHVDLPPGRL